ncbi:MAG TPA: DMT family transporter [Anaerolineales bacterium]|nr:DMT family transporter [Anaerolineales bacterium]
MQTRVKGISAALMSAFFLGMAPVFGKQAIQAGMAPFAVVAIRTSAAALLLLLVVVLFFRRYLYIYPAGMLICFLAGGINGIGSLFYYSALGRLDASLGQLLYALYPLFLVLWLTMTGKRISYITILRLGLAIPAVILLSQTDTQTIDWIGIAQMLIAAALYALHLPVNQHVLYDMPAPTVTLYTLIAMSLVVVPAYFINGISSLPALGAISMPVIGLTLVTFFSRLTLFQGVKNIGGMQTAILGLGELLVTVLFAHLWLDERLTVAQWVGTGLLLVSLGLVIIDSANGSVKKSSWPNRLRPAATQELTFPENKGKL